VRFQTTSRAEVTIDVIANDTIVSPALARSLSEIALSSSGHPWMSPTLANRRPGFAVAGVVTRAAATIRFAFDPSSNSSNISIFDYAAHRAVRIQVGRVYSLTTLATAAVREARIAPLLDSLLSTRQISRVRRSLRRRIDVLAADARDASRSPRTFSTPRSAAACVVSITVRRATFSAAQMPHSVRVPP